MSAERELGTGPASAVSDVGLSRPFGALHVGMQVITRGRTLTETDLVTFATLTGDMHPQHMDAEWAADTPFGGRIVHGMLLLSYAVGLADFDPQWVVALRAIERVVFKRPGTVGDTIRVEASVRSLRAVSDHRGLVGLELAIANQRHLLVRARMSVLWRQQLGVG